MFTWLISVLGSAAAVSACMIYHVGRGETIAAGIAGFIVLHVLIGWLTRRRIKKLQEELQEMLLAGQKQMNRKIQMFQTKPGGNIKQIQRQLEHDQKTQIEAALTFITRFEPFKKWSLFIGRQTATMRLQFLYQLKKFDEVDQMLAERRLLKKPILMEPLAVAMKMARQYRNGDIKGLEKTFKRRIKWYRGNRGTLLYALMSWVYMKQGESEKARMLLVKAKDITADETLARNWEMLANNKDKHFSNDGLGEEWFSLHLENPPTPKQQKVRMNARGGRPF